MKILVFIGCSVALLLGGCGQKGALYLPDKKGAVVTSAPAATPAPPPATAPAKKPTDPDDPDANQPPAK
jgi:predicted small lipoprotein YifL